MVKVAGYTHVGQRQNNEDSFAYENNFAVVADGMGGHSKGEIASAMAVECICEQLKHLQYISENDITNAVKYANSEIYNRAHQSEAMHNMGTTVVMCAWNDLEIITANVGDSRCYLYSENNIKQITKDHSYVQSLVDSGKITAAEAEERLDKNIILRAAGCEATVDVDIFKYTVKPNDKILLCSDGLSGALTEYEIKNILNDFDDVDELVENLVNQAFENGGTDNITAVVIAF